MSPVVNDMKKHGNKGNKNAQKGETAKDAVIALRCTTAQKKIYTIAANGEKLQLWVLKTLDLASEKTTGVEQ
jgi:hypothetical protein